MIDGLTYTTALAQPVRPVLMEMAEVPPAIIYFPCKFRQELHCLVRFQVKDAQLFAFGIDELGRSGMGKHEIHRIVHPLQVLLGIEILALH